MNNNSFISHKINKRVAQKLIVGTFETMEFLPNTKDNTLWNKVQRKCKLTDGELIYIQNCRFPIQNVFGTELLARVEAIEKYICAESIHKSFDRTSSTYSTTSASDCDDSKSEADDNTTIHPGVSPKVAHMLSSPANVPTQELLHIVQFLQEVQPPTLPTKDEKYCNVIDKAIANLEYINERDAFDKLATLVRQHAHGEYSGWAMTHHGPNKLACLQKHGINMHIVLTKSSFAINCLLNALNSHEWDFDACVRTLQCVNDPEAMIDTIPIHTAPGYVLRY